MASEVSDENYKYKSNLQRHFPNLHEGREFFHNMYVKLKLQDKNSNVTSGEILPPMKFTKYLYQNGT